MTDQESKESKAPTRAQANALRIIRDHGPLRPREFAQFMWPDSDGWRRSARCGANGSHRGGGMHLAGGGYLGKLRRQGWISPTHKDVLGYVAGSRSLLDLGYVLTAAGKAALDAWFCTQGMVGECGRKKS